MNSTSDTPRRLVSVVLPVFNELHAIPALYDQITAALRSTIVDYEIIFVNDGSTDGSTARLDEYAATHRTVRVLHLSRNFGHQAAVQAGLSAASGEAIILMDADLQDDPHALPKFIERWQGGYDVVYAVRTNRKEQTWKRLLFKGFYRLLNAVSQAPLPVDAGNFCLLDRCVLDCLNELPERDRYFPGLRSWVGFRQTGIEVERNARYDDTPRVSLLGLFRLAKTALFSFSHVPLTLFYVVGGISFSVCLLLAGFALYHKLITGLAIPGWTSTTMVVSLFGAINSLGIAILGEYAARIYDQVRARPNYIIARHNHGLSDQKRSTAVDSTAATARDLAAEANSPEAQLLEWLAENWVAPSSSHNPFRDSPQR